MSISVSSIGCHKDWVPCQTKYALYFILANINFFMQPKVLRNKLISLLQESPDSLWGHSHCKTQVRWLKEEEKIHAKENSLFLEKIQKLFQTSNLHNVQPILWNKDWEPSTDKVLVSILFSNTVLYVFVIALACFISFAFVFVS